ncbi:DUF3951 domain-containing protein [Brevibacillus reuszeri]|uniref:DUF3951 domain-containing protein n=1 Tax=Brevibacillus reuszeri TaxID=54915 RepID=UPI0028A29BCA|nr:DUF3951 domain-containing protein [Brevibacillus reuszeri]
MLMMSGLIIAVSIEHYYTPLDRMFGQTPIEYHEEKIEKKEAEDEEGDDKEKNSRKQPKEKKGGHS